MVLTMINASSTVAVLILWSDTALNKYAICALTTPELFLVSCYTSELINNALQKDWCAQRSNRAEASTGWAAVIVLALNT